MPTASPTTLKSLVSAYLPQMSQVIYTSDTPWLWPLRIQLLETNVCKDMKPYIFLEQIMLVLRLRLLLKKNCLEKLEIQDMIWEERNFWRLCGSLRKLMAMVFWISWEEQLAAWIGTDWLSLWMITFPKQWLKLLCDYMRIIWFTGPIDLWTGQQL